MVLGEYADIYYRSKNMLQKPTKKEVIKMLKTKKVNTYEGAQDYLDVIDEYLRYELDVENRSILCSIESALYSIGLYGGIGGLEFTGSGKKFFMEYATEYLTENK